MSDQLTQLDTFIELHGISIAVERISERPDLTGDDWDTTARHWRVTLARKNDKRRRLIVYFSQGSAHTEPPSAADVLNCLASDASAIDTSPTFDDWCVEYGYDTDSRKAERTYKQVQAQAKRLRRFFDMDEYEELLWETERL